MKPEFFEYLEKIEAIGSTTEKENILREFIQKEPEAEEFLKLTFNDDVYGLAEKTFYNAFGSTGQIVNKNYSHVSDFLYDLEFTINNDSNINSLKIIIEHCLNLSGDNLKMYLFDKFKLLPKMERKWFSRCLLKDLRCGVQRKTLNKVLKSLGLKQIEKFALQLCETINVYEDSEVKKYLKFPIAMECKYDGIRLQAEVFETNGVKSCKLTSRRGKDRTADYPEICETLIDKIPPGIILDGEIISRSFQSLTRKDDTSKKKYIVFDLLIDENLNYMSRYDNLRNLLSALGLLVLGFRSPEDTRFTYTYTTNIELAEHYSADNISEVREYYEQLNERGEEGIILKNFDSPYERGSRKYMFKCKKVLTADLRCIGYKLGEGKRVGMVSTLCLEDKWGKIKVDVGSGIDDDTSSKLTNRVHNGDYFNNEIVEIKFNEITETGSIRFPRFVCFRD